MLFVGAKSWPSQPNENMRTREASSSLKASAFVPRFCRSSRSIHAVRAIDRGVTARPFASIPGAAARPAFHVIEDLLTVDRDKVVLRDDIRLAALEFEGIGFGTFVLPKESWRPFSDMFSLCRIDTPPLGTPRICNVTELAALSISRSEGMRGPTTFLPIDMRRWRPRKGERVMALGFADLDVDHDREGDARAMSQYLYGSEATIIEVCPPDGGSTRPWPIFRVEAEWPGGMSGGPVFNEAGHVIGVVSTGIVGAGVATATSFTGWNVAEGTFQSLDPLNPGWIKCWVAFDSDDKVVSYARTKELLAQLVADRKAAKVSVAALNPATHEYMLM